MEILKTKDGGFKIKSKSALISINPSVIGILDKDGHEFNITEGGEYDVSGVGVIGVQVEKEVTAYRLVVDEINLCYLGNLSHKLTDGQAEAIDGVDILLLPGTISEIISQLEPVVAIPYGTGEEINKLLKDTGKEGVVPLPKFVVTKDKLPEELQIVTLE